MLSASLWRGLLMTVPLVSACNELDPRRIAARRVADTAAAEPAPTEVTEARDSNGNGRTKSEIEAAGFTEIRRILRRLAAAEQTYFAENGTYTDDPSVIGVNPGKNTSIRFLWISREGWAASGTHREVEGKDCVIYVGQGQAPPTTLKYVRSGGEGVPLCDDSSARPRAVAREKPKPRQEPEPEPVDEDTVSVLDVLDPRVVMKVDLRNLIASQESYFANQGVYARRTQTFGLHYLWHRDVRVRILSADDRSWAAEATHARFPGKSCVIWFGPAAQRPATDAQRRQANQSGEPVCDD